MLDSGLLERITARRAELDELEEQLAKQLIEVRAERDELAIAEKALPQVHPRMAVEEERRVDSSPVAGVCAAASHGERFLCLHGSRVPGIVGRRIGRGAEHRDVRGSGVHRHPAHQSDLPAGHRAA
ncbi:hypothetical protein [Streptomyces sp. HB132]|uniref:hypothetical protein n=1 Tax=Streptomyces sp. HB132 TaxID=767388 RepID=UPI001961F3CD|nr:hypothetical protein [Streptomyces sp. HB132]MBM7443091.1 hypothetical protein [Streptomyces sp. HB132]